MLVMQKKTGLQQGGLTQNWTSYDLSALLSVTCGRDYAARATV